MAEESVTSVSAAFEILLEEIEEEVDLANQAGSEAFLASDHTKAADVLQHVQQITEFRDRVAGLQREWKEHESILVQDESTDHAIAERRDFGRVPKGSRTPHEAFYRPILQVIVDHGGTARAGDVVDGIEPLMKDVLKEIEYTPLPSQPDQPRWRNRAYWTRYQMVQEGLLKDDSQHGIWEITEMGRQFLVSRPAGS